MIRAPKTGLAPKMGLAPGMDAQCLSHFLGPFSRNAPGACPIFGDRPVPVPFS